jgi:DNA-binding NarL/FixJ family response regulator
MGALDTPLERMQAIASAHADAVEGFYANYADALEARNHAVLVAVDQGWSKRKIAAAFRISEGRVTQIVALVAAVPAGSSPAA